MKRAVGESKSITFETLIKLGQVSVINETCTWGCCGYWFGLVLLGVKMFYIHELKKKKKDGQFFNFILKFVLLEQNFLIRNFP